jgi:hypothetical protein
MSVEIFQRSSSPAAISLLPGIGPPVRDADYTDADRSVDCVPPYHTLAREPTSFGIPDS